MMSITGVILTYERQIKGWADSELYSINPDTGQRLTVDELLASAREQGPDLQINTIAMYSSPGMPPAAAQGRRGQVYLDPHTGEILGSGNTGVRGFFSTMMGWHRWFDLSGESRSSGRSVTGAANLLFLFLLLSGTYLWLPPLWRRVVLRQRMFFNDKAKTSKARDYNWHHVFGFWSLLPLFLIVLSATTISYTWARNSVYVVAGEEVPTRGGSERDIAARQITAGVRPLLLQQLFAIAAAQSDDWRRIDVQIPSGDNAELDITIDEGSGGEPHKKRTLTLDRSSGDIVNETSFSDRTLAGKVLSYFRWVHTGEAHGLIGQTVAGLVSALAVLMAWTGVALAYRRLIQPIIRRRRLAKTD